MTSNEIEQYLFSSHLTGNSMHSPPTGKRLNTDSLPILANSWKKQRVHDDSSNTTTSNASAMPFEESTNDTNSLSMKNQANKLLMTFVQNQSTIYLSESGIPHAQLKLNLYNTQLVDFIMDSPTYSYDERQVWSLAALLFGREEPAPNTSVLPSLSEQQQQQQRRLRNWIRSTVIEEMEREGQLELNVADNWHRAFHYLSSGQIAKACNLVKELGDDALMTMIVVHLQQDGGEDVPEAAEQQVLYWQEQGFFDPLPLYQKKMWCVLLGRLGYVDLIKTTVTQGLAWPQVLLLYALYGNRHGDMALGLEDLHSLTMGGGLGASGIHQLQAREATAQIPRHCLWYFLLKWWASYTPASSIENTTQRKVLEMQLPLRCRWLLLLHVPDLFENEPGTLEAWRHQWCDELYHSGLEYMAILAGLYVPRPGPKIKQLLSLRQWEKEHYVARQLQIPPEWITDGKALYALNRRMYDKEVDVYLEAHEIDKARDVILNHMIPAIYLDGTQAETMATYLCKLAELYPNNMDLQQTTDTLHSIHVILNTYPRIISQGAPSSEEWMNMANGLKLALQNTMALQESNIFEDPSFCSKVTGKLISIAAMFMDNEQLTRLLDSRSMAVPGNQNTIDHASGPPTTEKRLHSPPP